MADGDAGSNLVSGEGTNALTFALPAAPRYKVESVVATVDNTAGADTGAVLVMADTNGAVIAAKRQGQSVDAGATTTATWALRLDDEQTTFNAANAWGIYFQRATWHGNTWTMEWAAPIDGTQLFDVSNPARPTPLVAGTYAFSCCLVARVQTPGKRAYINMDKNFGDMFVGQDFDLDGVTAGLFSYVPSGTVGLTSFLATSDFVDAIAAHDNGADLTLDFYVLAQRLN